MKKLLLIFSAILLAGSMWAAQIDNIGWACLTGNFTSSTWTDLGMEQINSNQYKGTAIVAANKTFSFKLRAGNNGNNTWSGWFGLASGNNSFSESNTTCDGLYSDGGNITLTTINSRTGRVKIEYEFFGEYSSNSRLTITQSEADEETLFLKSTNNGIEYNPQEEANFTKGLISVYGGTSLGAADKNFEVPSNNSCTISVASGYRITKIVFTYASGCYPLYGEQTKISTDNTDIAFIPEQPENSFVFSTSGNTGKSAIRKIKVEYELTPSSLTLVANNNDGYWATFSSSEMVEFIDATVYAVSINENNLLVLNEVRSKQVPANTGVLINTTDEEAAVEYKKAVYAENISNNLLMPGKGTTTAAPEGSTSCKFYRLAYNDYENATGLGFYYGPNCDNGQAFNCRAGIAYLAVENTVSAPARAHYIIGATEETGTATDVESVEAQEEVVKFIENGQLLIKKNGVVYNVMGQVVR